MAFNANTKESDEKAANKSTKGGNDLTVSKEIKNNFTKNKMEMDNAKANVQENDWRSLNLMQKAKRILSLITVEPILAFFIIPSVLSALATQNLYLEKACRVNLGFDDVVCDALTKRDTANYTVEEAAVQKLVAAVAGWKTVLQSFLPCVILLFLGAYSDRVGQRKFCMLLPIVGEFLSSMGLILNNYFFYQLPVEVAAVTEAIFPALTGGWSTMFMGVFSYIADVTTEDERTLRIGIVNIFYSLGVPIGSALSGILVQKIGFYGVFSLSASLYVVSFVYGFFRIKEVKRTDLNAKPAKNCCEWLRIFFDIRYVKDTVMVAFKPGPNNRRLRIILLIIVLCVVIGPVHGEMSVLYLYTRFRFNWNEVDFSIFSTYSVCTSLIGTLFSIGVFSHILKFDDAIIGVISSTSKVLSSFMFAFATTTWQLYIAPLIEIFNGTSFIAMRSMVSKSVDKADLGKVNSFFALVESMMPLAYAPLYTSLYRVTINTFPGAFFLLGGALTVPAVLIFLWLYFANKKFKGTEQTEDTEKDVKIEEKFELNGLENKSLIQNDERREKNNFRASNTSTESTSKQSQTKL